MSTFTKHSIFLILLIAGISITSCSDDDEVSSFAKFEGQWQGVYTGIDDNGTFTVEVSSTGAITGTANSNSLPNFSFALNGNLNADGMFSATYGSITTGDLGEFTGTLDETNGNGTWTNTVENFDGTWTATKQ